MVFYYCGMKAPSVWSVSSSCGEFSISCFLQMVDGSFSWAFFGVYGPYIRVDNLRI